MHPSIEKLVRFTATIRAGLLVELMDTHTTGRVRTCFTRFKLNRVPEDNNLKFQMQTEVRSLRGNVGLTKYTWCDWTIQGIVSHLLEYNENEVYLLPLEQALQDPLAAQLATLETSPVLINAAEYVWDAAAEKLKRRNSKAEIIDENPDCHHFADIVTWNLR